MISKKVIIFCNMFCEVYKSHPWRHGYPPEIRQISGAAMNLNCPYCETTNQIDDFLAHIQSQERNSFDMLRKSTFCSHFYLFKKVRILFVVRTFFNIRERTICTYSCSCSHFRERMETLPQIKYIRPLKTWSLDLPAVSDSKSDSSLIQSSP